MPESSQLNSPQHSPSPSSKAVAAVRLSNVTSVTTSPERQRAAIERYARRMGLTLIAEATDLGVSARDTSPFERPSLSTWLGRPAQYDVLVWAHVDRAVRSVPDMVDLIAWGRRHERTLVFGTADLDNPLVVAPATNGATVRRCMDLAELAERESLTLSNRLTSSHEALRMMGRYGGGLVPFGYRKAPHPSGSGWCLAPDPEAVAVVQAIVADVLAGLSLIRIARKLNDARVPVPRDRHAQLQGRPTGGRRHGRDFERFRWTSGTLSKVLRSPSLMGHRVHQGRSVRDATGAPVLIGTPLLTEEEFQTLQDHLAVRSNGSHPKSRTTALLTGIAHCAGCDGRMYFAARKGFPYGDYVCRATARGDTCSTPAGMRSDWLEQYTLAQYRASTGATNTPTRKHLLLNGVRVTVAKGRSGGASSLRTGPDCSRLAFTMGEHTTAPTNS